MVSAVEKVTRRKMLVKENTEEELTKLIGATEGVEAKFYIQVKLSIAQGKFRVEPTLNKVVPDVKPWTVEEFLERYWSGVELGEAAWVEDFMVATED